MAWRGSFSRSVMSAARASRSSPPLRPPPLPRLNSLRLFPNPRNLQALGGAQSLMPLYSTLSGARLTDVSPRAYSELSHGTFYRTCQDRYYLNSAR